MCELRKRLQEAFPGCAVEENCHPPSWLTDRLPPDLSSSISDETAAGLLKHGLLPNYTNTSARRRMCYPRPRAFEVAVVDCRTQVGASSGLHTVHSRLHTLAAMEADRRAREHLAALETAKAAAVAANVLIAAVAATVAVAGAVDMPAGVAERCCC